MIFLKKNNPVISPTKGTFYSEGVTGLGFLKFAGENIGYLCGINNGSEEIGYLEWTSIPGETAIGFIKENVVIPKGKKGDFDECHVCDPAAIFVDGLVYLYYSGLGEGQDSIGLAISRDGKNFKKMRDAIIIGRAPEVVYKDGIFHLFYVLNNAKGGYEIYLSTSEDGFNYKQTGDKVIITSNSSWDNMSVSTPRIIKADDSYYCFYCGDDKTKDMPKGFGVCRSKDLITWEKAAEPVLDIGTEGSFDQDAVWVPTVFAEGETLHMWYEGGKNDLSGRCISSIGYASAKLKDIKDLFD